MEQRDSRNNNFGFLRLLLATLVIVSHSPQLLDGDRTREILTRIFGTMSLGDLAVDGFFLISGYLVTKSFVQSASKLSYLKKRALRIYPGFLVSFWVCVLLIAPFVGADEVLSKKVLAGQLITSVLLLPPKIGGVFSGLHYRVLNGSMGTISAEFGCYITTLCAGTIGLYSRELRAGTAAIVFALLLGNALTAYPLSPLRFTAVFGVGVLYYIYRDKVRFTHRGAIVSALMLLPLMFSARWAEASVAIFGGYLIFWTAFRAPVLRLSKLCNEVDLSYGMYLYAWPIASVIAWKFREINPWLLSLITFAFAGVVAYSSWTFVEKPCLSLITKGKKAQPTIEADMLLNRANGEPDQA